jgi:hypothetical protein
MISSALLNMQENSTLATPVDIGPPYRSAQYPYGPNKKQVDLKWSTKTGLGVSWKVLAPSYEGAMMVKKTRRKQGGALKAKIALEAVFMGDITMTDLAQRLQGAPQSDMRLEEAVAGAGGAGVQRNGRIECGTRGAEADRRIARQDRAVDDRVGFFSIEVRKMSVLDRRCAPLGLERLGVYHPRVQPPTTTIWR